MKSKLVLLTGGSQRIGACIARRLHAQGATLALHYRQSTGAATALADELNAQRPDSVSLFQADLRDTSCLPDLVDAVVKRLGGLDALINNASSFFPTPVGQITEAAWDDLVGSNFKAPLFLCQAAAPHLAARQGAIVNITDVHAERPLAGYPLYCAAKGALLTLTRALAIELAPQVRVNAVAPGPILWPEDGQFPPNARADIIAHTLLQRAGTPQDIADSVLFLLSGTGYITGQVLNVDGGRTAHL